MSSWGRVVIDPPDWIDDMASPGVSFEPTDRMPFVIELARRNVVEQTGGPFGAAIFESASGILVAPGVNRVVPTAISFAHAETTAIGLANQRLGVFDLGGEGLPAMELVASTEPCALCMGATVWSGVRKLVTGARDQDARSIGFDEGPKVADWQDALRSRGIEVEVDVMREEAAAILDMYAASGALIYNGRNDA
ncbi:MAG: nucleoside deaminase [Acidimicrobiia bacterium]|nr:nucleoside deaminase [Acidimicrobiia bacterium]MDH5502438.1 nucleoside deaminase [Acidimicrobiia bacterium]